MESNILKKIQLISKSGFLASSLLNIGAMEKCDKGNIESCINSINSNINNINNNVDNSEKKNTNNLFLDNKKCKDIDEKIFFQDGYKYKSLYKLFSDNKIYKFDFKKRICKSLFHDITVFNFKNDMSFDLKKFDFLIEKYNTNCKEINKFKYSFYEYNIKNLDPIFDDEKKLGDITEKVAINNFKEKLQDKIIDLYNIIIENKYSISEELFNPDEIKNYDNEGLIFYYLLFKSIDYMISFYKCNFPNLYKKYENFLKENKLNFIFRNTSEKKDLENDFTTGATTEAYFKNNDSKNDNFSININKSNFVNNLKGDNASNFLNVVSTVIHEMLHFITLTINYDILKEQETLEKSYKNRELCFIYFLYGKDKLNNEDKKKFEERLGLLKNTNSEIYFNQSYCKMGAYELPNICLTDFFMNNILKNIIEFINKIEAYKNIDKIYLKSHLNSLTKQIFDSGKNKKYTIKIGEKILNFIKNYDDNLAGKFNESDDSNNDSGNDDDKDSYSDDEKLKIDDFYSEEEEGDDNDEEEDDNDDKK